MPKKIKKSRKKAVKKVKRKTTRTKSRIPKKLGAKLRQSPAPPEVAPPTVSDLPGAESFTSATTESPKESASTQSSVET